MTKNIRIGFSLAVALYCILNANAQTEISGDGIMFPDGTIQTTAASAAEAIPYRCIATSVLSTGTTDYLDCYKTTDGSGSLWNDVNGVPEGYFFLVTDVTITPITSDISGGVVRVTLTQFSGCDNGVPGHTGFNFAGADYKLAPDLSTFSDHYRTPAYILPGGHCLQAGSYAVNTHDVQMYVLGYLTSNPTISQ